MTSLDKVLPAPRLLEVDHADLAAPAAKVWENVRHGELGRSPLIKALFAIRTLPSRITGRAQEEEPILRIDAMRSTPEKPGFAILVDDAPRELVVGAIGKVWQLDIPFLHVPDADAFLAFNERGWIKVAWAIRVVPHGDSVSRVEIEVRVDATDDDSWHKFRRYFRLIGPGSHIIRRAILAQLGRELGLPEAGENERPLPGDELLPDAAAQITDGITIEAAPAAVWPWLLQMGCRRAGFYSIDLLDNGGVRSAREVHPELQEVKVGERLPARPEGEDGFEVLRVEPGRLLVLGGLYDPDGDAQLDFAAPRPERFWQVTWAFVLEPRGEHTTRLHVRVRGAFSATENLHATWIRPVHHLMEHAQLRHLAERAEGRVPRDDWRDVLEGLGGAATMALLLVSPFGRKARSHWGLDEEEAARAYPGDELVPSPRWSWTHGVEIDAPAAEVWPWVAQIGADRAGFYSYQWLENVAGCKLRNAETIHPEWQVRTGDGLRLHPKAPPLSIDHVEEGRCFVAFGRPDAFAAESGRPWVSVSWLFLVEPLGDKRCRFISRYRCACSDDLATRLQFGPALIEPIGFAMDRRMLLGVKERAERREERLLSATTDR